MARRWRETDHRRDRRGRFARIDSPGDPFSRRVSDQIGAGRGERKALTADEQDLADELIDNGAQVNADGTVTLYHFTTTTGAERIRSTGTMRGAEDGVFFTSKGDDDAQGGNRGSGRVKLRIPLGKLQLDDLFGDEAHVRIPTRRIGDPVDVSKWIVQ